MTERTTLFYRTGDRTGSVDGSWTSPAVGGKPSRHRILSIGYPIMAASVSEALQTNRYTIDVPDAGGVEQLELFKSLPNTDTLVSIFNAAIREAYSGFADALPQYVRSSKGWFWTNPTASDVTLTFPNTNSQQLILGKVLEMGTHDLVIPAGEREGPFFPDSRLGAVAQTLQLHPGQSHEFELPLFGAYRDGALFRPENEIVQLNTSVITGEILVSYPSISSRHTIQASNDTQIVIISLPAH